MHEVDGVVHDLRDAVASLFLFDAGRRPQADELVLDDAIGRKGAAAERTRSAVQNTAPHPTWS